MEQRVVPTVLLVSALASAVELSGHMATELKCTVELANSRRTALTALRRQQFCAVVIDQTMIEGEPAVAQQIWDACGFAVPVEMNFAITGPARLMREVRAALQRRENEHKGARKAALACVNDEVGSALTGIMLEVDLALATPAGSPINARLENIARLTTLLRQRMSPAPPKVTTLRPAMAAAARMRTVTTS
jgi:CheY-like chemotaxis protein